MVALEGKLRTKLEMDELTRSASEEKEADMNEVSLVSKIAMVEEDKRLAYGVVLVPDEVDSQGDVAPAEVIEEAAHDYLASCRAVSKMHMAPAMASVVESYIAPCEIRLGTQEVKKGSWVIAVKVADEELWERIRSGEYGGFSVGGLAERAAQMSEADSVPGADE